ncbi:MAG: pyrroline-5-carboxylate reductase [Mogibacterium sp.]|nr:pyrroline-5-carboxylate reductase [Mogibacterium sp.]
MDLNNAKVGYIGFGNMASAICDGLLAKNAVSPSNQFACARDMDKLRAKCEQRGINAMDSAEAVCKASDIIVLAVLPQQVEKVVKDNAEALRGKPVFSVAAGIDYDRLVSYLGEGFNHISTIPNTPIAVGEGIITAEQKHSLTPEQLELFEGIFGQIAKIEYFNSDLLSLGGTGAGCAPAFVDVFIEALADGLVKHGMTRAQAYSIVPQMLIGTATYMMKSGKHPGELKDAVCSPGGTTIVGISALEEKGFRSALIYAIDKIMEKKHSM